MLSAAEWETFTPTINELIKWEKLNYDLVKYMIMNIYYLFVILLFLKL